MKQYTAFLSWPSLFSAINKKRNFPGSALTHSHNTLPVCVFGKYFSIEQKYIDPSPRVGQSGHEPTVEIRTVCQEKYFLQGQVFVRRVVT